MWDLIAILIMVVAAIFLLIRWANPKEDSNCTCGGTYTPKSDKMRITDAHQSPPSSHHNTVKVSPNKYHPSRGVHTKYDDDIVEGVTTGVLISEVLDTVDDYVEENMSNDRNDSYTTTSSYGNDSGSTTTRSSSYSYSDDSSSSSSYSSDSGGSSDSGSSSD